MGGTCSITLQEDEKQEVGDTVEMAQTVEVTVSFSTPKKRRARKVATPVVQLSERRFTRSCLKMEGYRPQPMLTAQPNIKKKSRAKLLLVNSSSERPAEVQDKEEEGSTGHAEHQIPVTPLHVIQRVGTALGISPAKLTREQLEADPKEAKSKEGPNDK
jgi:hypothetical protein